VKKIQRTYPVSANGSLGARYRRLMLEAPQLARCIRPGQFVHVRVSESLQPFFRRPFSVYRARRQVEIVYEVIGPGTRLLAQKQTGDRLDILGPLGNAFQWPGGRIKQAVMIAGGIGIAPFMILSDFLKDKNVDLLLLYGARNGDYIYDLKEFQRNRCRVFVATEDGSVGKKGRVSSLYSAIETDPDHTMLYACGPRPMLADVQRFAARHGLNGQASCEEVMACGVGACRGCVIKTTRGYKTVCEDGPVFDLQELIF